MKIGFIYLAICVIVAVFGGLIMTAIGLYDLIVNFREWNKLHHLYSNGSIHIWVGNGVFFIDSYPEVKMFNIFEKFYIHRCIKKSIISNALYNNVDKNL